MTRRFIYHGVVLGTLALGAVGCEPHHSLLRPKENADALAQKQDPYDLAKPSAVQSEASKMLSIDSDSKDQKPFFGGGRRSGGWSSEARSIEKDLGVN
jgi:hypothetical protein